MAAASWGCAVRSAGGPSLGLFTSPVGCVEALKALFSHPCSDNKGLLGCLARGERLVSVQPRITLWLRGSR